MKLSPLNSSLNQIFSHSPELKIAGEFSINKFRFLIISEDNLAKSALLLNDIGKAKVVGQFQFEGETYVIVKEREFAENEESNLAKVLTARELQVAALVAQGKSNKQIAKQLQISKWTVSTYLRRIFMKLQVDSRAAMVYSCIFFSGTYHN